MPERSPPPPAGPPHWTTPFRVQKLILLFFLLLLLGSLFLSPGRTRGVLKAAPAKGGEPFTVQAIAELALDENVAASLTLSDAQVSAMLDGRVYDFVHAVRLAAAEVTAWPECGDRNCAHVVLYNISDGGTVEAIVHLDEGRVLSRWADPENRPGPSTHTLARAMTIAAVEPAVNAVLGDISAAESAMVPMPIWLADDACSTAWCVDLTFHDPAGSGRIFHIVVNMEEGNVARTFFSRARPDRTFKRPLQQEPFTDNCHEQYGWSVCWEMTAHDGVVFSDATYQGELIFSSVKIGQAEVWYPAWPGGYRDEIGFQASVPPQFDTEVNDLRSSFEVRQLFTQFLRWPNCICCYRYEQVLRFYQDGTFEFRFVSHGPGCEDLSEYRPFWRIDLDLGGSGGDRVYVGEGNQWTEATTETEWSVFENSGPQGYTLFTQDGDLGYRWRAVANDPLGLDEARLFAVQAREGEGDGPIATGPADTYQPPRQYIDGDPLSGENVVLWYVPVLKTKQGGPWWCMPDPEPDFSPCTAILRAEPAGELPQPEPTSAAATPVRPTNTPPPTTDPAALAATPRPIAGADAQSIIAGAGCVGCHLIGEVGEDRKVGPDLSYVGLTAGGRVPGMSAAGYLRQSITDPNVYLAPECPNGPCLAGVMPQNYQERLTAAQIDLVVDYMLTLKGPTTDEDTMLPVVIGPDQSSPATATPQPFSIAPEEMLNVSTGVLLTAIMMAVIIMAVLGVAVIRYRRGSG
jgi:hypothetical protein